MRTAPLNLSSHHLDWRIGAILFRSILCAVVVLLFFEAIALKQAEQSVGALLAGALATSAAFALFSWRTIYPRLAGQLTKELYSLSSHFWAMRLMLRARRIRVNRLRRLLTELRWRRESLRPLWKHTPAFREYVNDMLIFVLRREENPLATLVFSEALTSLGMQVRTYEDLPELPELWTATGYETEFRQLIREVQGFKRVAVVFGHGGGAEDVRFGRMVEFLSPRAQVLGIPLFQLAQSGEGLFPEQLLYELPAEFHGGLKHYLQQAASLAKKPRDKQFENQAGHARPVYR